MVEPSDYRFLVAEHALDMLDNLVRGKRIPAPIDWAGAAEALREARAAVKRMRYSYLPGKMLATSEDAKKLMEAARVLAEKLLPREWVERLKSDRRAARPLAEARYAIRILYGLPARLLLGEENNPAYAVDIECVKILSVEKHPDADRLWVTRAHGRLPYTIVTNIETVRRGEVRAAAILPPQEFRGVISEAMYCSEPLEACEPGKRPPRGMIDVGAIGAVLEPVVRRYL